MAGRNYTFYVKDLTQFLKDNHGFKGCDGTVRRALIRAGFKRKLVRFNLLLLCIRAVTMTSKENSANIKGLIVFKYSNTNSSLSLAMAQKRNHCLDTPRWAS